MKTLSILSVVAVAIAAPAFAEELALPPTYLVHKLTADGLELRSLEAERGLYEARVVATDGQIVKVGIDPQTAELTDAYSHAQVRAPEAATPKVNAVDAVMAVAATGYWDVRELDYKHGQWRIKAADDQGHVRKVAVDGATGLVK